MAGAAAADDAPPTKRIEPDRRDFTTGTGIVSPGMVQIESGATWEHADAERRWTLAETTLRVPLAKDVEFRLRLPAYRVDHAAATSAGFDDTTVEARYRFYRGDKIELGVQATAVLGTGSHAVAEGRLQPGAVVAASLELSETSELVVNLGGNRASSDGERFWQAFFASSFRIDLGDAWSGFAEAYAFNREEAGGEATKYVAVGTVFFVDRDIALDARVGKGLHNGGQADWLASLGVSHRF